MVWEPRNCCCCSTPRTGTLVLGWLGVIFAALGLMGTAKMALMPKEELMRICHQRAEILGDIDDEFCYSSSMSGIISGVIEQIIQGAICVLLLVGVNKRNQCLMLPWMIMQLIGIVVMTIVSILMVFIALIYHAWLAAFLCAIVFGSIIFLCVHFLLVVRVCYKEVKMQQLTTDNDIEVGQLEPHDPSPAFKNLSEYPGSSPPAYSKLENQATSPPPYKM